MEEEPKETPKQHPTTSTQFLQVPSRHDFELSSASSVLELSSIGEECTEPESTQNV